MLWLLALAWLLFALSWGALHWLIVPRVGEWRPTLEALASRAIGLPVSIGQVSATSIGPVPSLEFKDVVLSDAGGNEALRLSRVSAALSLRSLWQAGFDQLVIDGPTLELRRTQDGAWLLAGIALDAPGESGDGRLLNWFLDQTEFAILNGTVRWIDDQRPHVDPLELTNIHFVLRHRGRQHQFRLDATPPSEWGAPFTVQAAFSRPVWTAPSSAWQSWSGQAYADLPLVDAGRLGDHVDLPATLGMDLEQGRGSARLWLDIDRGELRQITTDLALPQVLLRWAGAQGAFDLRAFQTRLELQHRDRSTQLTTRGLSFLTGEGTAWPGGDVSYRQTLGAEGELQSFALAGERLDAQAIRQLVQHLPIPGTLGLWLSRTQASGHAESFGFEWQAPADGKEADWRMSARLRQVSLAADVPLPPERRPDGRLLHPLGRPGLSGADITFSMTPQGGEARLVLQQGDLVFPGVFENPTLTFDRLEADASWTVDGDRWAVAIPRMVVKNADVEGEVRLQWHTADPAVSPGGRRFPGVLALDAQIHRAEADRVVRYLPQHVPTAVRRYLSQAIRGGQASDGRLHIAGDLWHFPFAEPDSGAFVVSAGLQNVVFDYAPPYLLPPESQGWPGLSVEQARLSIDRTRLSIEQAEAAVRRWPALRVSGAHAVIEDFSQSGALLTIRGQAQGPAQDALAFIDGSPVRGMTGQALRQARATGLAELDLALTLPLGGDQATRVDGQVRLAGNDLRFTPTTPVLQAVQGTLRFNENGFDVPGASARLLGGGVRFTGGMQPGPETQVVFQGQGQVTVQALADFEGWPWLAPLRQVAAGQAAYQASLSFSRLGTAVQVDSNLQGMALQLPAPFDKPATTLLPLRLTLNPLPPMPGESDRDELTVELGAGRVPLLSLNYLRASDVRGQHVLAGSIGVRSERPPMPRQGVYAQVQLDHLNTADWEQVGQRMAVAPGAAGSPGDTMRYWPTTFGLTITQLEQGPRVFRNVVAGGTRVDDTWRLSVDADELSGHIEYRQATAQTPGQLYGRLARLDLSAADVARVETLLQEPPRTIPAIDLDVQAFRMGGRDLGRLEVRAVNRQAGLLSPEAVSEWRLNTFNLTGPEARLQASGNWVNQRTALRIQLDIEDSGQLLERFDMPGVVRGGRGRIEGHIGWSGSPLSFHPPSLNGALSIDVERGQFLKAEPGIAKLLGVLSLQSLPRRLALDFRDVFSEGFAFDFMRGHASIRDGIASTNNLQMKGVSAAVLIEGQADIVHETQDITAVVIPELNAGTASLVATMISPVTGLGTFLAQFLLRQPLQEAATRQFHITGSWAEPQVERISRRNIGTEDPPPNP